MKLSNERILTTHTGSLPRTPDLVEMMVALSQKQPVDQAALATAINESTSHIVLQQIEAGIDIGNDGEQSRETFFTYVQNRLSGYAGESQIAPPRDITHFPSFVRLLSSLRPGGSPFRPPKAVSEVRHTGLEPLSDECADFKRILQEQQGEFEESFMTAASPGIVCMRLLNDFYPSYEDYLFAVAESLRPEYEYIISQGLVLQVDCPDLAIERHMAYADSSLEEFLEYVEMNIAALNSAISGLPREQIRMHICWGNSETPHLFDVPLAEILPLVYQVNAGAILLPFGNPRHEHEWRDLERFPPPKDTLIVAGVIDTTTNYVEHPEVVAQRIERVVQAIGDPTRVLAGTDCGFASSAWLGTVAEEVVWEKLRSLRSGADLATQRIFG